MNFVHFSGWIATDVTVTPQTNGEDRVSFRLNVSGPYKEPDGKWHLERFNAVAYGDAAADLRHARKDDFIDVTGWIKNHGIHRSNPVRVKWGAGYHEIPVEHVDHMPILKIQKVNKRFHWQEGRRGNHDNKSK